MNPVRFGVMTFAILAVFASPSQILAAPLADAGYANLPAANGIGGGLVALNYSDQTVQMGIVGLQPDKEYSLVARTIKCGGKRKAANRAFGVNATTDGEGALFSMQDAAIGVSRSLWLTPTDGSRSSLCVPVTNILTHEAEETQSDALGSAFQSPSNQGIALVQERPNNRALLAISVVGITPGHQYGFRFVGGACGSPGGTPYADGEWSGVSNAEALGRFQPPGSMTAESIKSIRSVRINDRTASTPWACIPMSTYSRIAWT